MNNIETKGIPDLSNETPTLLDTYLRNEAIYFNDWSTNNDGLLIRKRYKDSYQAYYLTLDGEDLQQLTNFNEPVSEMRSSNHTQLNGFVYNKDVGGNEDNQIFYFDLDKQTSHLITDGKSKNDFALWNTNGTQLAYRSNARNQVDFEIYLATFTPGNSLEKHSKSELVFKASGNWYPVCWSFDDRFLIVNKFISALEAEPHLLNVETGQLEKLFPKSQKMSVTKILFSKQHDYLYVISDENTEFLQLRLHHLKTGKQQILTEAIKWNVESIAIDRNGENIAFISNENGYFKLYVMDTETHQIKSLPNLPKGQVHQIKFDKSGNYLAMNISSTSYANEIFVYDIANLKIIQQTINNKQHTLKVSFTEPKLIHYTTFDTFQNESRKIPAFCYLPDQEGSFPSLIHIHGGPEGQFVPGYHAFFQYLVKELGIAIIAPNVRGSRGYGKTYLALDDGYKREDSVKDIGALLNWIEDHPNLNKNKIAVMGGSYGGYMVYAALIQYAHKLTCGISRVGISNFVTFLENTKAYRRNNRREEYGDERIPAMRKFLTGISPTTHAHKINKPLLIVQGANDPRVPQSEAEQMYDEIKKNNIPVWYLLAKDEGHGFKKKKNIDFYQKTALAFLKQHLIKQV